MRAVVIKNETRIYVTLPFIARPRFKSGSPKVLLIDQSRLRILFNVKYIGGRKTNQKKNRKKEKKILKNGLNEWIERKNDSPKRNIETISKQVYLQVLSIPLKKEKKVCCK